MVGAAASLRASRSSRLREPEDQIPMIRMTKDIDLSNLENRSILLIDDNHSIHRDYKAVLCPEQYDGKDERLDELEDMLFSEVDASDPAAARPPRRRRVRNFYLQSAFQGQEAYELVKKHYSKGIRYPLAFVDMRMPPGWDGLETIEKLREVDDDMFFAIVTAYSDHTYETIIERLGSSAPVRILYKPFDPAEIYEMAFKIVSKWNENQVF